jgi:DNA polymerase (family 10)
MQSSGEAVSHRLSNAQIADKLVRLAQLLGNNRENFYKIKAYRRAATSVRNQSESLDEMVRHGDDLTRFPAIGAAIAGAIQEIVLTGGLKKLDTLSVQTTPELLELAAYPGLDPKRILRIYKKLAIASIDELRQRLESGAVESSFGVRMAQHVRQGLNATQTILLYRADTILAPIEEFLLAKCGAKRVDVVGDFRRRVEVVDEMPFLVETEDFASTIEAMGRFGGGIPLLSGDDDEATFSFPSGVPVRLIRSTPDAWGLSLIQRTGAFTHVSLLDSRVRELNIAARIEDLMGPLTTEGGIYEKLGLTYIEPELREGNDEVERAANGTLSELVRREDLRGELHAHSQSSDGIDSIEQMAVAARDRGYEYIGITDHSQSLKIARGVSIEDLWSQIRYIDSLNARLIGIRVLKSAEVDILADGSLDYPDELLKELDYTVCSVHSRFGFGRTEQTERIMRAMDNRYFNILGHATGRLLLKRPGYDIDIDRIISHARQSGCFFEINSSPDRLDLSSSNARKARQYGVKIAISTDAHSMRELDLVRYGLDQARRAGIDSGSTLNSLPWDELTKILRR